MFRYGILVLIWVLTSNAKTIRKVCQASSGQVAAIKSCEIKMEADCGTIPSEKRRDCFQDSAGAKDLAFLRSCASGTGQVVKSAIDGVKEVASNAKSAATDSDAYMKSVRKEAAANCRDDYEYRKAKREYELMFQNRGPDEAYSYSLKMNQALDSCVRREIGKGKLLGMNFDLIPNVDELKNTFNCFNGDARVEMGCGVAVPMLLGGATAIAVRTKMLSLGTVSSVKMAKTVKNALDKYKQGFKERFSLAAAKSIEHQTDLLAPLENPALLSKAESIDLDVNGYVHGVLDSDMGKVAEAQKILFEKSPQSDTLLNVLKGTDNSKAGQSFRELLNESGLKSPLGNESLINPALSNDTLRQAFQNKLVRGYMHELPGIDQAIQDLNAGRISSAEFKSRVRANLFHNGPQKGFWDFYTQELVPGKFGLEGNPELHGLFKNSILDSGKTTPGGVTIPVYRNPISKEGILHQNFDRLSQGTGGGSIKIGYELMGDEFSNLINSGQSVKIGAIPKTLEANGLNTFRDLFLGNKEKNVASNPTNTLAQFDELGRHIQTAKFLKSNEAEVLSEISRASRDRTLAFKDFIEKNMKVESDASGNVERMILQDENGKVFASFTKDSDAKEVYAGLEKMKKIEEKLNGDPFKDLMRPRFLSPSEKLAYGLGGGAVGATGGAYFYCNQVVEDPKPLMPINPFENGVM